LNIHQNTSIVAYLQAHEIPIGLTSKEHDWVVHWAKRFKWEDNSLLHVWSDGQMWVVLYLKQREAFVQHVHKTLNHFGVQWTYNLL
jgi:hypothetical protein